MENDADGTHGPSKVRREQFSLHSSSRPQADSNVALNACHTLGYVQGVHNATYVITALCNMAVRQCTKTLCIRHGLASSRSTYDSAASRAFGVLRRRSFCRYTHLI